MGVKSTFRNLFPRNRFNSENYNPHYRLISYENPTHPISECYRRIKVSLNFSNVDKQLKVIGLTSAVQGEGKSLTLLNLAYTYVEDGHKVLIIDLDLRRPKIHKSLRIENKNGISEICDGSIDLNTAIKHSQYGFDVINSGKKVEYPASLLGSKKLETIVNDLKKSYDVILIDCPPVVLVSDPIIISRLCDGLVFCAAPKIKQKEASIEGVRILRNNNVNLLGCVFTEVDSGAGDYYYHKNKYYYYSYGDNNQENETETKE